MHAKGNLLSNGTFDNEDQQSAEQFSSTHPRESMSIHVSANSKSDKVQNLTSGLDVSNKTTAPDGRIYKSSNLLKTFEASEESEGVEVDVEKVTDNKIVSESSQDQSSSILDKLFGNVLTVNGGGSNSPVEVIIIHIVTEDKFFPYSHILLIKLVDMVMLFPIYHLS